MSSQQQRQKMVLHWWGKAEKSIEAARREIAAKDYDFAINRLYYALFYGVMAALLERGLSFKKHSGVRSAFHKEFIKKGILNKNQGKLYDRLFEDRQEGDYTALVEFDEDYVEKQLENCIVFLQELRFCIGI